MFPQKRSFEEAFEKKNLKSVKINDFYAETTIYKVENVNSKEKEYYDVTTSLNSKFQYGYKTIKETATSASIYEIEKQVTKTELIKLFSQISTRFLIFTFLKTYIVGKRFFTETSRRSHSIRREISWSGESEGWENSAFPSRFRDKLKKTRASLEWRCDRLKFQEIERVRERVCVCVHIISKHCAGVFKIQVKIPVFYRIPGKKYRTLLLFIDANNANIVLPYYPSIMCASQNNG